MGWVVSFKAPGGDSGFLDGTTRPTHPSRMTYESRAALGSFKRARAYINKVFGLEEALARLHDERSAPKLPLRAALVTWFWAMIRRLPSTEQVGDMLLDDGWRRRLAPTDAQGGSPDTLARILEGLSVSEINDFCLQIFFAARRAKVIDTGPYGQCCAIVDLNELFTSTQVHCEHCQVRRKHVADANGDDQVAASFRDLPQVAVGNLKAALAATREGRAVAVPSALGELARAVRVRSTRSYLDVVVV